MIRSSRNFNVMESLTNWLLAALMFVIVVGGAVLVDIAAAGTPEYYNPSKSVYSNASANSSNNNNAVSGSISQGGQGGRGGSSNQSQGQDAHNEQGQSQGLQAQDLVNVDLSNHSRTHVNNPRLPAQQAYAPGLVMGGNEVCMGSSTAGGQGASFGFSVGSTWTDRDCVRRKDATFLAKLGDIDAARQLMCQQESVASAYEATGINCGEYRIQRDTPQIKTFQQNDRLSKYYYPDGN